MMRLKSFLPVFIATFTLLLCSTDAMAMYNPRLGRFMQRDPIGYPNGFNAFAAYHIIRGGLDPSGLYEIEYEGDWTDEQKKRVEDSLDRIDERITDLLDQLDELEKSLSDCVKNKMEDSLNKIRNKLKAMQDNINSKSRNLELYQGKIPTTDKHGYTNMMTKPSGGWWDDWMKFNTIPDERGNPWDTLPKSEFDRHFFHEQFHITEGGWGTNHDDDGTWEDPHKLDKLIGKDIADALGFDLLMAEKECGECPLPEDDDDYDEGEE
ncbi:hypothetical protein JD969_09915 [Planctomycetota bacterium]|nr:hypothetical protein JD969_09915 [Planctomycetota bacterium]